MMCMLDGKTVFEVPNVPETAVLVSFNVLFAYLYDAVTNAKGILRLGIFMKHVGHEWIMHGLCVDDMFHTATSDELRNQFISEYREDFDITLEDVMSTFLGMEIEHNKENLAIHLDTYIRETLAEYKAAVTKFLKQKQVQMHPGVMLELEDCRESPDPVRQKIFR